MLKYLAKDREVLSAHVALSLDSSLSDNFLVEAASGYDVCLRMS